MKLRLIKIQISYLNIAFTRLMLAFSAIGFLFSFHLFAQSQIHSDKSEPAPSTNFAQTTAVPSKTANGENEPGNSAKVLPAKELTLTAADLVQSGDTLDIDVLGSLEYDWRGKIDDEGFLSSLPSLNVSILALCRTEDEIGAEISAAYSKIIRNPQVIVRVLDRSARPPAILFGAVSIPQRFQIQRPVRLGELIVMSGGITDQAGGEIHIFRPARVSCVGHNQNQAESQLITIEIGDLLSGKADANVELKTGDVITVEEAAPIYITGGVIAPQHILFRSGITLSRAIASAGGVTRGADQTKITIYRQQKGRLDLKIIEADLQKILDQKAEDIPLEPYDIVEIAQNGKALSLHPPVINQPESSKFDINKLPIRLID